MSIWAFVLRRRSPAGFRAVDGPLGRRSRSGSQSGRSGLAVAGFSAVPTDQAEQLVRMLPRPGQQRRCISWRRHDLTTMAKARLSLLDRAAPFGRTELGRFTRTVGR